MKNLTLILVALLLPFLASSQKEGNFWTFGFSNSVNFSSGSPVYGGIPGTGSYTMQNLSFNRSNAIADANGKLLFFVKLDEFDTRRANNCNIYTADGDPMVNSELVIANPIRGPVHIIKKPGSEPIYYVVYSLNYALLSTTVDMRLNNGKGGVVLAEKSVMLSPWQSIVGEKTTVTSGCEGSWLVVRSRTANQYLSFKVTRAGIDKDPVVSNCGLLPLFNYNVGIPGPPGGYSAKDIIGWAGLLKASKDGKKLVACCDQGLELYDFSSCSGKVTNPMLIDTAKTYGLVYNDVNCGYWANNYDTAVHLSYYSACFSPDNSKLYATYYFSRKIYQFDLDFKDPADIIASKMEVLTSEPSKFYCGILGVCAFIDTLSIGDLKMGPDNKIYIGNNAYIPCNRLTPGLVEYHALHTIHAPNQKGMACNPQINGYIIGSVKKTELQTYLNFNPDIVIPKTYADPQITFQTKALCAGSLLKADSGGACFQWSTGALDTGAIIVTKSGIYWVRYFKECVWHTDTFQVYLPPFPEVTALQYGCPEDLALVVQQRVGDTTIYLYRMMQEDQELARSSGGNEGAVFKGLSSGNYQLHIRSLSGCDTVIEVQLYSYPYPDIEAKPMDTTILYGGAIQVFAKGATRYAWSPAATLSNPTVSDPIARPKESTRYMVIGTNDYGCKDTGYVMVRLDYELPDMMPNAFSPNGDGLNDVFRIEGVTYQQLNFFRVYNRFGQLVFFTTDISKGWEGMYKEQPCDAGTYYYQVELVYPDGRLKRLKGDVVLLR